MEKKTIAEKLFSAFDFKGHNRQEHKNKLQTECIKLCPEPLFDLNSEFVTYVFKDNSKISFEQGNVYVRT